MKGQKCKEVCGAADRDYSPLQAEHFAIFGRKYYFLKGKPLFGDTESSKYSGSPQGSEKWGGKDLKKIRRLRRAIKKPFFVGVL